MALFKAKQARKLAHSFRACFCDESGNLSRDGEVVIAYLRDICCAKGELGKNGNPYFYDKSGRYDPCAAACVQAKRNVFDQVQKYLALDERKILNLIAVNEDEESNLIENINL